MQDSCPARYQVLLIIYFIKLIVKTKYETIKYKALKFNCPGCTQKYEKEFYGSLNMEYVTNTYYRHGKTLK